MPDFGNAFETTKSVEASRHGDVRWVMAGQGLGAAPGATFTPIWWIPDAGDLFLGARLSMSIRDAEAADACVVELWSQETRTGSGILAATFTVAAAPAGQSPSLLRTLGVVGVPGRAWGVRARMTTATARQLMFELTLFCRFIGSGVLWRGENVT